MAEGSAFVDGTRIGIWGWSYGGHMTLHAMFDMPGVFKAGFAGGPVTIGATTTRFTPSVTWAHAAA